MLLLERMLVSLSRWADRLPILQKDRHRLQKKVTTGPGVRDCYIVTSGGI
jgi:hypothetical protein